LVKIAHPIVGIEPNKGPDRRVSRFPEVALPYWEVKRMRSDEDLWSFIEFFAKKRGLTGRGLGQLVKPQVDCGKMRKVLDMVMDMVMKYNKN